MAKWLYERQKDRDRDRDRERQSDCYSLHHVELYIPRALLLRASFTGD